jgi:hypothetical protein
MTGDAKPDFIRIETSLNHNSLIFPSAEPFRPIFSKGWNFFRPIFQPIGNLPAVRISFTQEHDSPALIYIAYLSQKNSLIVSKRPPDFPTPLCAKR